MTSPVDDDRDLGDKDIVNQVKETGKKLEIQEVNVSVFDFGPDLDLTKSERYEI